MKRTIAGLALALALGACGGTPYVDDNKTDTEGEGWTALDYEEVTLPNGRVIPCLIFNAINEGGISCDWSQK